MMTIIKQCIEKVKRALSETSECDLGPATCQTRASSPIMFIHIAITSRRTRHGVGNGSNIRNIVIKMKPCRVAKRNAQTYREEEKTPKANTYNVSDQAKKNLRASTVLKYVDTRLSTQRTNDGIDNGCVSSCLGEIQRSLPRLTNDITTPERNT